MDLGTFDRMLDPRYASRQRLGEETFEVDAEQDQADSEPSLGSLLWASQTHWAAGDARDLEEGFGPASRIWTAYSSRSGRRIGNTGAWYEPEPEGSACR